MTFHTNKETVPKPVLTALAPPPYSFIYNPFRFSIRMEFKMQITATPTSANTAHHIPMMPSAPRIKNRILINSAKAMFW